MAKIEQKYHFKCMYSLKDSDAPAVLVVDNLLKIIEGKGRIECATLPMSGGDAWQIDPIIDGKRRCDMGITVDNVYTMPEQLKALKLIDEKQRVETKNKMSEAREKYMRALEREMRAPHNRALQKVWDDMGQ